MKFLCVLLALFSIASLVRAEEVTPNSQILTYLERNLETVTPKMAWNATTPAEHEAWRGPFREKLMDLLGEWPEAVAPDVRWDSEEVFETDAFTRRKVYVRTETDYWAPAYYYTPKGCYGKAPRRDLLPRTQRHSTLYWGGV